MTVGSYDAGTGEVELQPVHGEPRVFVIAGNGTGKAVFEDCRGKAFLLRQVFYGRMIWIILRQKHWQEAVVSVAPFGKVSDGTSDAGKKVDGCV